MTLIELVVILVVGSAAGAIVGAAIGLFSSLRVVDGALCGAAMGSPVMVALIVIGVSVNNLRRPK